MVPECDCLASERFTSSRAHDIYPRRLFKKALNSPKNLPFHDFLSLTRAFGSRLERTSGSHHILVHDHVPEPLNIQEVGGKAKPYQVRQFLRLVEVRSLELESD